MYLYSTFNLHVRLNANSVNTELLISNQCNWDGTVISLYLFTLTMLELFLQCKQKKKKKTISRKPGDFRTTQKMSKCHLVKGFSQRATQICLQMH